MRRRVAKNLRTFFMVLFVAAAALGAFPSCAEAWGRNAHRLILNKAVDTLPSDVRSFFEASRGSLLQNVPNPLNGLTKNTAEKRNEFIAMDKYRRLPLESLTRRYKATVTK